MEAALGVGLFIVLGVMTPAVDACSLAPRSPPRVELTLEVPLPGKLRATLRNSGDRAVHLLIPPDRALELYGSWGGWQLTLRGAGRQWQAFPYPGPVLPVDASHCRVLASGSEARFDVDVSHWIAQGDASEQSPRQSQMVGNFELKLGYLVPTLVYAGPERMLRAGEELSRAQLQASVQWAQGAEKEP